MSEAQVAEEVDRIRKAAVRNHTPEVYKLCYSAVDLTTLSCTDSVESVTEFAGKAVKFYQQFPHLPNVASICIYPPFVETVGVVVDGTDMRITSVAGGFPSSQTFLEVKVLEVAMAVENGADEIDIVLNVGKMLEGHYDEVANEVEVIRTEMSPEVVLKVIIESGALKTPDLIRKASLLSMFAGADFVKTSTGKIVFAYHKLRCAISMSLEVSIMAYPMFEAQFVRNVANAMVKAKEQAIINGTGSGQPKGILAETAPTGQNIDIAAATTALTYKDLCKAEAALPQAYDGAVWFMSKKTFETQIVGMVDNTGQPVARVNYGINGKPVNYILGREVILTGDYLPAFAASVTADTVFAFMFDPAYYLWNENMGMTVKRYTDEDTDDEVTKAIEIADGACVDVNSLVTLTKKKA